MATAAGLAKTPGPTASCWSGTAGRCPTGSGAGCAACSTTGQIAGAWAGKELLRQLLVDLGTDARPYEIRARLERFYTCAAQEDIPELTTLATTVETWWPEILGFLQLRITNARTEGYNRTIKTIKRIGCGFRNERSYRRRIMLHIAATAA